MSTQPIPPQPDRQPDRQWWRRTLVMNAVIAAGFILVIQLVPVSRSNPPVQREPVWDSNATRALAAVACFDCHSNETQWPAYTAIAPLSWVSWYDVSEGREALNFSEWNRHINAEAVDPNDPFPPPPLSDLVANSIRDDSMPPGTYRLLHPEAQLSDADKEALIAGLTATIKANQGAQETPE